MSLRDPYPMQHHRYLPDEVTHVEREVMEEVWKEYAAQGHGSQTLDDLAPRGGFDAEEIIHYLYDRCLRLQGKQRTPGHRAFVEIVRRSR